MKEKHGTGVKSASVFFFVAHVQGVSCMPAPPQPASSMAAMHTHRASAKTFFIMIFLL